MPFDGKIRLSIPVSDILIPCSKCHRTRPVILNGLNCRKCLCSRQDMCTAETYDEIHSKNHEHRTNQSLKNDYAECQALEVKVRRYLTLHLF